MSVIVMIWVIVSVVTFTLGAVWISSRDDECVGLTRFGFYVLIWPMTIFFVMAVLIRQAVEYRRRADKIAALLDGPIGTDVHSNSNVVVASSGSIAEQTWAPTVKTAPAKKPW